LNTWQLLVLSLIFVSF